MGNIISNREDMNNKNIEEAVQFDKNFYTEFILQDKIETYEKILFKQREKYMSDVKEAETYIEKKFHVVQICDYGNNLIKTTNLLKNHESLMKELEDFDKFFLNLKNQIEDIKILESKLSIDSSSNLISIDEIQTHLECKFEDLMKSAKYRQKKLNANSKTFILLNEAAERVDQTLKTISQSEIECEKITEHLPDTEFSKYYNNYQISIRTSKVNLIILNQMDTEISKLDKEDELIQLRLEIKLLEKKILLFFEKLGPIFEKEKFLRDIDNITTKLNDKFHKMLLILIDAEKDENIYLNFRLIHDRNLLQFINVFKEKINELNKRQELFLQINSTLAEDCCKFQKINNDWTFFIDSIMEAREIIFQKEEKLRLFYDCRQLMGRLVSQLSVISATMLNLRDINNNINLRR